MNSGSLLDKRGLRTYRLKDFLNEHFTDTVRKMPLHSGLGCPHRDAENGDGGCIFCFESGFTFQKTSSSDIHRQIDSMLEFAEKKGYRGRFMAYFQTGTNTFAATDKLRKLWDPVLQYPEIVAMAVGTRPDCVSDETVELLRFMAGRLMVWIELGLQSSHNRSLEFIHRGHDYACFKSCIQRLANIENLFTCVHIILGLPNENKSDMMQTILRLNALPVDGIKFHHLQVVKNTKLEQMYLQGKISVYTIAEYVDLITDLIPRIPQNRVIHRLTGEIKNDLLVAPRWPLAKVRVVQLIEEALKRKKMMQGDLFS